MSLHDKLEHNLKLKLYIITFKTCATSTYPFEKSALYFIGIVNFKLLHQSGRCRFECQIHIWRQKFNSLLQYAAVCITALSV